MKFFLLLYASSTLALIKTEKDLKSTLFENEPRKEIPVVQKFVNSKLFNENYVTRSVPLVMKAAADDLFEKKFDESFMMPLPHSFTTYLEVKNIHDNSSRKMSIYQFLNNHEHQKIFIDTPIPSVFKSLMNIPKSLLCQPIIEGMKRTRLVSRSGDWSDAIQSDLAHSLNCILNGNANYNLLNASAVSLKRENSPPDGASKSEEDALKEAIRNGRHEVYATRLEAGDCLFIPSEWFQKRSTSGNHISFSLHWTQNAKATPQTECIQESKKDILTLPFPDDPQMDILSIIQFDDLHYFIREYYLSTTPMDAQHFMKKLRTDKHLDGIPEFDQECKDIAEEMFQQMDFNGDGKLSKEDFQIISQQELKDLSGRIDDRLADFEDIKEDVKSERKGSSLLDEARRATSGNEDIRKLIEKEFGEIFGEISAATGEASKVKGKEEEDREMAEIKRIENMIKDSISSGASSKDEL